LKLFDSWLRRSRNSFVFFFCLFPLQHPTPMRTMGYHKKLFRILKLITPQIKQQRAGALVGGGGAGEVE